MTEEKQIIEEMARCICERSDDEICTLDKRKCDCKCTSGSIAELLYERGYHKQSEWISVEERLPNVNKTKSGYEEVFVIATTGKAVRPMIYERACVRDKVVYRWKWVWDRIYDGNDITHWMPLPEPPKMEGKR